MRKIVAFFCFLLVFGCLNAQNVSIKKFWELVNVRYTYKEMSPGMRSWLYTIAEKKTRSHTKALAVLENIRNEVSFQDEIFLTVYIANYKSKEDVRLLLGNMCGSFSVGNPVADWVFGKYKKDPRAALEIKTNNEFERKKKDQEIANEIREQRIQEEESNRIAIEKRKKEIDDSILAIAYKKGESIIPATPVDGINSLRKLISENYHIPDAVSKSPLKGRVNILVQFTVDTIGNVTEAKTISETLGYGLEEEAIRVIKLSKWTPAKDKETGLSVKTVLKQNITLRVNDSDEY